MKLDHLDDLLVELSPEEAEKLNGGTFFKLFSFFRFGFGYNPHPNPCCPPPKPRPYC